MDLVKIDFDPLEEWEKIKIVGRGGSSVVYQAKIKRTGEYIAAKEIPIDGLTKDQVLAIEGEVETMKNLNHSSIVNYLGTRRYSNHFYIFMEYADMGSLRQFYQKHGALSECHAAYCVKQILLGLNYLHSNGIAHRDVKGANVLMTRKGEMKLADFGASKRFDSASLISGLKGTPHWMAPEVIKGTQMTTGWMKADVWSLGCTVVELLTGSLPFAEYENPMTAMYHIANGKTPPLRNVEASVHAYSFVNQCCALEPNDRPSVSHLLNHPFVHSDKISPLITAVTDQVVTELNSTFLVGGIAAVEEQDAHTGSILQRSSSIDCEVGEHSLQPPPPLIHLRSDSTSYVGTSESGNENDNNFESIAGINELMRITRERSCSQSGSLCSDGDELLRDDTKSSLEFLQAQMTPEMTSRDNKTRKKIEKSLTTNDISLHHINRPPAHASPSMASSNRFRQQSKIFTEREKNGLISPLTSTAVTSTTTTTPLTRGDMSTAPSYHTTTSLSQSSDVSALTPAPARERASSDDTVGMGLQFETYRQGLVTVTIADTASPMSGCSPPLSRSMNSINKFASATESTPLFLSPVDACDTISTTDGRVPAAINGNRDTVMCDDKCNSSEVANTANLLVNAEYEKQVITKSPKNSVFKYMSLDTKLTDSNSPASLLRANPLKVQPSTTQNISMDRKLNVSFSDKRHPVEKEFGSVSIKEPPSVNANWNGKTSANIKSNGEVSGSNRIVRYEAVSEDDDIATPLMETSVAGVGRPVAPLSSEKLKLHSLKGADAMEKAGQSGAAAVRKHALISLGGEGEGGASKSRLAKKQKASTRSKSAGIVTSEANKLLVLPPMQNKKLGDDSDSNCKQGHPNVPKLQLRIIQSAPSVSRSINLPPILKSKTPSKKLQGNYASYAEENILDVDYEAEVKEQGVSEKHRPVNSNKHVNTSKVGESNSKSCLHDENESCGGILAPRGR